MLLPPPRPRRWATPLALAALLADCLPTDGDATTVVLREPPPLALPSSPVSVSPSPGGPARRLLATLVILKDRAPRTGYAREQFGHPWADVDHNGCDTHNDILGRDLTDTTFKPAARPCVVLSGVLADPYTGTTIQFARGVIGVDVDHVVALGDAWVKGASQWPPGQRLALANDPLNLLAVDASANRSKGDGDAATWLPPSRAYRCKYVARQVAVKAKYALALTRAEHDAMAAILDTCADEPAPVGDAPTSAQLPHAEPRAAAPKPRPADPPPSIKRAVDPNYGTCKQAKASGKGPYVRGRDPEYDYYQDRDADGTVCE